MSASTNSLVVKAKRFGAPAAVAAALLLVAAFVFNHNAVHAATVVSPVDESTVSPLEALDNAIETVASRVTPAVVNVEVTSRGSAEQMAGGQQQFNLPPGMNLPPFEQFFGP